MGMSYTGERAPAYAERSVLTAVYGWMTGGLAVTGMIAFLVASDSSLAQSIQGLIFPLIIGELILVFALSGLINRISPATAAAMFIGYSALNGLTLSILFMVYTQASIASTFFVTAGTFGAMSFYGFTTKRDLTSIGNLCFMGLIGIIIASVVNMFMASANIYWAVTYIGVLVFVGLTAYDTQKIKRMAANVDPSNPAVGKVAIMGALALYLDFINLFILLLRIFGRRR